MIRLLNADCMDVMRGMASESVDCIVTDPPYGTQYKSGRQGIDRERSNRREGDVVVREEYFTHIHNDDSLPVDWIKEAYRILADNSAIYIFCHWSKWGELACAVSSSGFDIKNMIVLNKSNHGMGDLKGSYAPKHELLMFAAKGRHILRFPSGRINDVWDVPVKFSGAIRLHPNEKPVSWAIPAIENSTDAGQTVFDPFMGSAFVAEACLDTGRDFVGCEIDAIHYCTAINRVTRELRAQGKTLGEISKEIGESIPSVAKRLK